MLYLKVSKEFIFQFDLKVRTTTKKPKHKFNEIKVELVCGMFGILFYFFFQPKINKSICYSASKVKSEETSLNYQFILNWSYRNEKESNKERKNTVE